VNLDVGTHVVVETLDDWVTGLAAKYSAIGISIESVNDELPTHCFMPWGNVKKVLSFADKDAMEAYWELAMRA
jgi:hypothetical protein